MTAKLELNHGATQYGSQMGRPDLLPADRHAGMKLHLQRVRLDSGGYDHASAYWGLPDNLYCAWMGSGGGAVRVFARGNSRSEAKAAVRIYLPNARFYR